VLFQDHHLPTYSTFSNIVNIIVWRDDI